MSLEQGLALERELQAELFASHDAKEGLAAFSAEAKAGLPGEVGSGVSRGPGFRC